MTVEQLQETIAFFRVEDSGAAARRQAASAHWEAVPKIAPKAEQETKVLHIAHKAGAENSKLAGIDLEMGNGGSHATDDQFEKY